MKVIAPSRNSKALSSQSGSGKVVRRAGEQQDAEILEDVGDREAGQQQRHVGRAAHRAVGDALDDDAGQRADDHAADAAASRTARRAAPSSTVVKAPTIIMSPWAKLVMRRMPKTIDSPTATSA